MSDDLLRAARQFLAELDATEAYLRNLACQALPYRQVIAVERRAGRRSAELLAGLGGTAFEFDVDDATDELLSGAVRPRSMAEPVRQTSETQVLTPPVTAARADPLDDGPEGAADESADLLSEEEEPTGHAEYESRPSQPELHEEEDVDDEDTNQGPSPILGQTPGTAGGGMYVTYDESTSGEDDEVLEYGENGPLVSEEKPAATSSSTAHDDPFAGLVSFEESAPDEEEEQDATLIMSSDAKDQVLAEAAGGVGQDALVTIEEGSPDILDDALGSSEMTDGDLEELELDLEDDGVETFDLMPDLSGDDEPDGDETQIGVMSPDPETTEDEPSSQEVVLGRSTSSRSSDRGSQVTAGLYGNPNVPTIRDTKEPRPRAAAIQLNAGGGGSKVLGLEEEAEPIAVGSAEDDEDFDESDLSDGFSVTLEQYEDEDEYEEEDEDEEVVEPARPVPVEPPPPSAAELAGLFDQAQSAAAGGDLQTGADLFSDVIDLEPDHVDAHVGRGRLYLDLGDYSRAMSDFMVAEEIEPSNPEPQIAIGDLYFARKDYRKAIDYFNAALEMSPNHAMAFCRRGISHYYRKNYKDALDDLLRAQKLNAEIPNIQTYVSMAKKKAKR